MRRVVASLAAVLASLALASCGGGGAEPGALKGATLVLDFTPNAVHSGIYEATSRGLYRSHGVELDVQPPSASSDAPKLLQSGTADFAILDIHDLGIARERGLPLVGIAAIVQRPLAAVIVGADNPARRPRDLEGRTVGVTGLPSDDAVVDSEVRADGGDPSSVKRVTIGFNAVTDLAAGKVDAATGFWNAEAVALARRGVKVRTFRVDDYGAPRYPELVLTTTESLLRHDPGLVRSVVSATAAGYRQTIESPQRGLDALLQANPGLERGEQQAQLRVLVPAFSPPGRLRPGVLREWAAWDHSHGLLDRRIDPDHAFGGPEYSR